MAEFSARLQRSFLKTLGLSLSQLVQQYGTVYVGDFERHLQLLRSAFPDKPWPQWPVRGYVELNKAILLEEISFRRSGEYSAKPADMARVIDEVYGNADVMDGYYLVGLYCTYFLWPHHYQILEFFRKAFLDTGPAPGSVMEWGVGHGLLTVEALARWPSASAAIVDLSPFSLNFAERLIAATGLAQRHYLSREGDVLAMTDLPQTDRIICSELLEHVAEPGLLLKRIHEHLLPTGYAYLTGAINAAQPDHVYLFRTDAELLDMVRSHGFVVRSQFSACHPNRQGEANPPGVLAMIVQRAS